MENRDKSQWSDRNSSMPIQNFEGLNPQASETCRPLCRLLLIFIHSFIHPSIHPSKPSRYNWSICRSVQCQHHKNLCSSVTLHFFIPHTLSPIWWCRQNPLLSECRCCPGSDFTLTPYITYCQGEQVAAVFQFLQLLLMCHYLQWGWLSGYSLYLQINQPTRCINFSDLLLVIQIQLNMFRASSCPSSGAYKLQ